MNREALERLGHDSLVDLVLRQEEVLEEYVERLEALENQVTDLTPGPLGMTPKEIRERMWPWTHDLEALEKANAGPALTRLGMTAQEAIRGAEALSRRGPTLAQNADAGAIGVERKDPAPRGEAPSHPVTPHSAEQWTRRPYVGEGADGARRSAEIDRTEAEGLAWSDPRRVELLESAARWERQADLLDLAEDQKRCGWRFAPGSARCTKAAGHDPEEGHVPTGRWEG